MITVLDEIRKDLFSSLLNEKVQNVQNFQTLETKLFDSLKASSNKGFELKFKNTMIVDAF